MSQITCRLIFYSVGIKDIIIHEYIIKNTFLGV